MIRRGFCIFTNTFFRGSVLGDEVAGWLDNAGRQALRAFSALT